MSARSLGVILLFFALITLSACDRQIPASAAPSPSTAHFDLELAAKIDRLEQELRAIEARVNNIQLDSSALISTENEDYDLVKTRYGTFTISAKSLTPYLDGFKAVLQVGNLTTAEFAGAEISVAWGAGYGTRKVFKVLNRFRPGSFTEVELALTPAKPEDVKKLWTTISVNQLVLLTR